MIGRTFWMLGLLAIALITCFAQLDRAARSQPELANLVPTAFRGFSAERQAEAAIAAQDVAAAQRETMQLVRMRPLPAEHLRLMAQAAALDGDSDQALAAMEAATKRGWRDPIAQLTAGQSALLQGRHGAAVQRLGALFGTGALPEQRDILLAELLAQPAGRAAFAAQLAIPSRWLDASLATAAQVAQPEHLAATLALAVAADTSLPCDRIETIAASYRIRGEGNAAAQFWPGNCAQS